MLPELLASTKVRFFPSEWKEIDTKGSLAVIIENITSIGQQYLEGTDLQSASAAA